MWKGFKNDVGVASFANPQRGHQDFAKALGRGRWTLKYLSKIEKPQSPSNVVWMVPKHTEIFYYLVIHVLLIMLD